MMPTHMIKQLPEGNYLVCGFRALTDAENLRSRIDSYSPEGFVAKWTDLFEIDIGSSGYPVAIVDVHHNREEIIIYQHPRAHEIEAIARSQGFVPCNS